MHPLLTFSTGILAGIAAVRWLKSGQAKANALAAQKRLREMTARGQDKAASGLGATQQTLRDAAVAGLSAVETSSKRLRSRLKPAGTPVEQTDKTVPTEPAES